MSTTWDPAVLMERVEGAASLDRLDGALSDAVGRLPERARSVLEGQWLGHPLHPVLTDLPIGFWTTSWLLDLTVPKRAARTSTAMVGLGVAAAVPTMAAGLTDWAKLSPGKRRVGLVHLGLNVLATAAYASSFAARVGGRRRRGIALGMLGAALATGSGYVGGHLAFGSDRAEDSEGVSDDGRLQATAQHLHGEPRNGSGERTEPLLGA
jgi:uncharacterized membrane protein